MGVQGARSALKIYTTGTNSNVYISFKQLVVASSSYVPVVLSANSVVLNSASSGVNGRDSNTTLYSSTFYDVYVISDDYSAAALATYAGTTPVLPSPFVYSARVGTFLTDSTTNAFPLSILQINDRTTYVVTPGTNLPSPLVIASGVTSGASVPVKGVCVPPSAIEIDLGIYGIFSGGQGIWAAPSSSYSSYLTAPLYLSCNGSSSVRGPWAIREMMMLENSYVQWGSSDGSAQLRCGGYRDTF
jgi:hypothetical protein